MVQYLPASNTQSLFAQKVGTSISEAIGQYFSEKREDQLREEEHQFKLRIIQEQLQANKQLADFEKRRQTQEELRRLEQQREFTQTAQREDAGFIVSANDRARIAWENKGRQIDEKMQQQRFGTGQPGQPETPQKDITIFEDIKDQNGSPITMSTTLQEDEALANKMGYVKYQPDPEKAPRYVLREDAIRLDAKRNTDSLIKQRKAQTAEIYYVIDQSKKKDKELERAKKIQDRVAQTDVYRDLYNESPTDNPDKFKAFQADWEKKDPDTGLSKKDVYQYIEAEKVQKDPRKLYERALLFTPQQPTEFQQWEEAQARQEAEDKGVVYTPQGGTEALSPARQQRIVSNALWIRNRMEKEILKSGDTSYLDGLDDAVIQAVQMERIGDALPVELTKTGGIQDTQFGDRVFITAMAIAQNRHLSNKERNTMSPEQNKVFTAVWQQLEKEGMSGAQTARQRAVDFAATRKAAVDFTVVDMIIPNMIAKKAAEVISSISIPDLSSFDNFAAHLTDGDKELVTEIAKGDAKFYQDVLSRAQYITEKLKVAKAGSQKSTRDMQAEKYGWSGIRGMVNAETATGQPAGGPAFASNVTNTYPQYFGKLVDPNIPVEDQQADRILIGEAIERYKMQFGTSISPQQLRQDIGKFLPNANVDYLIDEYERTYTK